MPSNFYPYHGMNPFCEPCHGVKKKVIGGSLEGTLQYYHHATPGEPLQGSPGVAW